MAGSSSQTGTHLSFSRESGIWSALAAFGTWGFLPLYWKLLEAIPAFEILCQRIVWSFLFMIFLVLYYHRGGEVVRAFKSPRTLGMFALSGCILATNWGLFIWAVNHDMVLQTSLGYYINPLLSMLLGVLFFGDRPRPVQWLAIALAVAGVMAQVVMLGHLPVIALVLAVSFAVYGALRKLAPMESIPGLALETLLLFPFALGLVIWQGITGESEFLRSSTGLQFTVILSGVVTSLPLVWFAHAARRLSLVTLGVMQYFSPSISFLLGIFVFREQFTLAHAVSFGCIWLALAVYSVDSWRAHHPAKRKPSE